jgi:hypothetical protein
MSLGIVVVAIILKSQSLDNKILTDHDFIATFCTLATLLFVTVILFMQLDKNAGAEVSGHNTIENKNLST